MNRIKRIFKLSEIKYPWALLLSMATFIASLYIERNYDLPPNIETVLYGIGFVVALIWSILNYMSHLKLNRLYKAYDDIDVFVGNMTMKKDEKIELVQYLNDFVRDLEEQGETHESAVKKAIGNFQVQEFSEAQGGNLFEKPTHYYLLGYVSIFVCAFIIINFLNTFLQLPFILSALSLTLTIYSIGLFLMFFIYKLIDILMAKK